MSFACVLVLSTFTACDKNIELEPETALDGTAGFKTKQDVDAALIGCYSALQSANYMGLRYWALGDMYADILAHTGTFPSFAQVANRSILADNVELRNMWQQIYIAINRANNVIASAPGVTDPSFNVNNAIGEARFLRAYNYFNLLAFYGGTPAGYNQAGGLGVPLVTTPTLTAADAAPKPRNTEAEVWALILEDLDFAVQNLVNTNGTGRANKRVANALKARVHLFRGEWTPAENAAGEVITTGGYSLIPGSTYADIYLKKNTAEAIWELQFDVTNANSIAFFYYPTNLGGRNEIASTTGLRDAHEAGDVRQAVNYTTTPAAKTQKYTRVPGDDNVLLIRLAEMYLIRAEAQARSGKLSEAVNDLNTIRTRAGLGMASPATAEEIVAAVEKERRLEFAHEGHRWFDLRRYNKWSTVGITQEYRALWPIPQREVETSAGIITQNPGY
ncbi:MAG: RagB/SusD family nutrient uptake outer membrane protein [Saprospiraceae bacterium]|nr:RagB/SusD family nutrient uptake outer membrane protein [Saprospiraceae bacterium]